MSNPRTLVATLTLALGAAMLAGCSSSGPQTDPEVISDLTPELRSINLRPVDYDNRASLTYDTNKRLIADDWARMWLIDRPSRLAREPIAH